jgi:asparagine synthase (glutamine-hydrolysing)
MCGLFAMIAPEPIDLDLGQALDLMRHRGPDGRGTIRWPGPGSMAIAGAGPGLVHLGHVRLAILELSDLGAQPMSSPDGRHWLILNGEIYNHVELRRELESTGWVFRGRSDTEVALAALIRWGVERALQRFTGMFALLLLDTSDGSVVAARDPFGIKPLYHATCAHGLALASEPQVLASLPGVGSDVDAERLWHYLGHGVTDHGDGTLFAGVRQIPGGHYAIIRQGRSPLETRRYWQPPPIAEPAPAEPSVLAERLRHLLLESVRLHLRSDVPVGVAVSGGLDSSAIICAMRHLAPHAEIHAFTYDADDPAIAESGWAARAVEWTGARWHRVSVGREDMSDQLASLVSAMGEPFGSTSILAQHAVFQAARSSGIRVMLDGQGADELFAGYGFYQSWRVASLIASGHATQAFDLIMAQGRWPGRSRMRTAWRSIAACLPAASRRWISGLTVRGAAPWWADRRWFAGRGVAVSSPFHGHRPRLALMQELHESVACSQLPGLLRYEDRNSMRNSVESRVPFLTTGMADFALGLPEAQLVGPDGTAKRILRDALRGLVPDALLDRRDKIGFATPESSWLRSCPGLIEQALAAEPPGLDIDAVRRRLASGRLIPGRSFLPWRLVNYGLWHAGRISRGSGLALQRR